MFHNSRKQTSPGRAYKNSSGKHSPTQPRNLLPAAKKSLAYAASVYIDALPRRVNQRNQTFFNLRSAMSSDRMVSTAGIPDFVRDSKNSTIQSS